MIDAIFVGITLQRNFCVIGNQSRKAFQKPKFVSETDSETVHRFSKGKNRFLSLRKLKRMSEKKSSSPQFKNHGSVKLES